MVKRPFLLLVASLLFLYFPAEWVFKLSRSYPFRWLDLLIYAILPSVLLVGLIRVTKVGWYTLIGLVALLGIQDLNVYYSSKGQPWSLISHLAIYLFSLSYFINPRVRHLYFDPKLRWWRTKPRFETYLPMIAQRNNLWDYPVVKNISEGGCFIETQQLGSVAENILLSIPLPIPLSLSVIQIEGEIRWISQAPNRTGMGIQFKKTTETDLFAIKELVRQGL